MDCTETVAVLLQTEELCAPKFSLRYIFGGVKLSARSKFFGSVKWGSNKATFVSHRVMGIKIVSCQYHVAYDTQSYRCGQWQASIQTHREGKSILLLFVGELDGWLNAVFGRQDREGRCWQSLLAAGTDERKNVGVCHKKWWKRACHEEGRGANFIVLVGNCNSIQSRIEAAHVVLFQDHESVVSVLAAQFNATHKPLECCSSDIFHDKICHCHRCCVAYWTPVDVMVHLAEEQKVWLIQTELQEDDHVFSCERGVCEKGGVILQLCLHHLHCLQSSLKKVTRKVISWKELSPSPVQRVCPGLSGRLFSHSRSRLHSNPVWN